MSTNMKHLVRIALVNIIILVAYLSLTSFYFDEGKERLAMAIVGCIFIVLHALLLEGFSIFKYKRGHAGEGLNYILVIGLVFLLGFGVCKELSNRKSEDFYNPKSNGVAYG